MAAHVATRLIKRFRRETIGCSRVITALLYWLQPAKACAIAAHYLTPVSSRHPVISMDSDFPFVCLFAHLRLRTKLVTNQFRGIRQHLFINNSEASMLCISVFGDTKPNLTIFTGDKQLPPRKWHISPNDYEIRNTTLQWRKYSLTSNRMGKTRGQQTD